MHRRYLFLACCGVLTTALNAATSRGYDMDYGPFFAYSVQLTNEAVAKGITVKLQAGTNTGAVLFDTETLRYAAGWSGAWLDLSTTHLATYKGTLPPRPAGRIAFANRPGPGWARNGSLNDPRTNGLGPLPHDWARYRGLYRHGSNVVFSYSVGRVEVFDMPGLFEANGELVFTRTVQVSETREPLTMSVPGGGSAPNTGSGTTITPLNMMDLPSGSTAGLTELRALTQGGPTQWPQVLSVSGKRGEGSAPFAVDTIDLPEDNPWRSWMRLTALDFFSDGRAAVTTWNGDLWIVSGLDDGLRSVRWKRFAAGLFDPLGLKIVRDQIFVLERSQITRLHDLNGDGEADFYECFNNDGALSQVYHAFAMDLQTDRAGNFYYTRAGLSIPPSYPLNGGMIRVSADGSRAEMIAHGLRAANGMSIGPNGEITCSDNQGNWIPSSRINFIKPGDFYGYVPHAHGGSKPTAFEPPLCWIPMSVDNSSASQVWVPDEHWAPQLKGHLLHTSYGMGALFDVLWETVDGVPQGGLVKFPLKFDSGIQRARFNPKDGQLYVVGLKGWQTKGVKDGAFQRVRYTSAPSRMPSELHVRHDGIEIGFTDALERVAAGDLENYSVEQWNYRWSEKYGSDDYSVAQPEKKGHDKVEVRSVKLLPDRKHVLLTIDGLKPVMQMKIRLALKSGGQPVEWEIYNTINRVPER